MLNHHKYSPFLWFYYYYIKKDVAYKFSSSERSQNIKSLSFCKMYSTPKANISKEEIVAKLCTKYLAALSLVNTLSLLTPFHSGFSTCVRFEQTVFTILFLCLLHLDLGNTCVALDYGKGFSLSKKHLLAKVTIS